MRAQERAALFDLYAANHERVEGRRVFACPLCLRRFDETALDGGVLAIEHVVPKSIGGTLTTLTCKPCNNSHGANIDDHLRRQLRFEDSMSGASREPVRGVLHTDTGRQTIDFLPPDGDEPAQIVGIPSLSHPDRHRQATADFENDPKFSLVFDTGYIPARSSVAVLRAGYLLAFRTLGYDFALRAGAAEARQRIESCDAPRQAIAWLPRPHGEQMTMFARFEGSDVAFVASLLNLSTARSRGALVILPPLNGGGQRFYESLPEPRRLVTLETWVPPRSRGLLIDARARHAVDNAWDRFRAGRGLDATD